MSPYEPLRFPAKTSFRVCFLQIALSDWLMGSPNTTASPVVSRQKVNIFHTNFCMNICRTRDGNLVLQERRLSEIQGQQGNQMVKALVCIK